MLNFDIRVRKRIYFRCVYVVQTACVEDARKHDGLAKVTSHTCACVSIKSWKTSTLLDTRFYIPVADVLLFLLRTWAFGAAIEHKAYATNRLAAVATAWRYASTCQHKYACLLVNRA